MARWAGKARPGCAGSVWFARGQCGARVGHCAGVVQASKDMAEGWGAGNDCCGLVSRAGAPIVRARGGGRGRAAVSAALHRHGAHAERCARAALPKNLQMSVPARKPFLQSRSIGSTPDYIAILPGSLLSFREAWLRLPGCEGTTPHRSVIEQ